MRTPCRLLPSGLTPQASSLMKLCLQHSLQQTPVVLLTLPPDRGVHLLVPIVRAKVFAGAGWICPQTLLHAQHREDAGCLVALDAALELRLGSASAPGGSRFRVVAVALERLLRIGGAD